MSHEAMETRAEPTRATQAHVAVLGAGNWGTTLAHLIASTGHTVRLWARDAAVVRSINDERVNRRYLDGFSLHAGITATADLASCVQGAELIVMVLPSSAFRSVCQTIAPMLEPWQAVFHATKGVESGSYRRMSQILLEETCIRQYAVISGPNIAREIMEQKPSGTVVASPFPRLTAAAHLLLTSDTFRVYENADVVGVEMGGTLKNVIAIASGISTELGLGENTRSLLVTRGLQEMIRIGRAFGADSSTFSGLAGIGDLMVTCASVHSRNFRLGRGLAQGRNAQEVAESLGMVAEGVYASKVAFDFARDKGIYAPVMGAVYAIVHQARPALEAIDGLMRMQARPDVDFG